MSIKIEQLCWAGLGVLPSVDYGMLSYYSSIAAGTSEEDLEEDCGGRYETGGSFRD